MSNAHASHQRGFTLVELMMVVALLAVLASVAIAKYLGYVEKARVAHAVAEIRGIAESLDAIAAVETSNLPDSLAYVDAATMLDPWGHPYRYLKLRGDLPPGMSRRGAELPPVAAGGAAPGGADSGGTPPDGAGDGSPDAGGASGGGGSPPAGGGSPPPGGGGPPIGGGGLPAIALARKDRFLVPINSDYDLYSMGPDGDSSPQLHNAVSRDDVIRARDGAFVGLAEDF